MIKVLNPQPLKDGTWWRCSTCGKSGLVGFTINMHVHADPPPAR